MNTCCFIRTRFPISLERTAFSHGWVNLAPWGWDQENKSLARPERISAGFRETITVTQGSLRSVKVCVNSDGSSQMTLHDARLLVERWLSIEWDPRPAIAHFRKDLPEIARYIETGGGRFLRGSSLYEDFVKTICTLNSSWSFTQRMVDALVKKVGDGVFPSPAQVISAGSTFLKEKVRMGYRGRILIDSLKALQDDGIVNERGDSDESRITYEYLLKLKGIGPYAASHVMMLLHDYSRIPIDSEVRRYCRERMGLNAEDEMGASFSRWGPYTYLGYKLSRILSRSNWIG